MQSEQVAIMPVQIASQLLMRGVSGAVPAVIGATTIAIGGVLYGAFKGTKAIAKNVGKMKPGENKADKITKSGDVIQAITIDGKLLDKFGEQAKALGVAFAACRGKDTANVIFTKKQENVVNTIMKTITSELEKSKNTETKEQKIPSEKTVETKATNIPAQSNFEGSEIEKIINAQLEKFVEQLKPLLEKVEKTQEGLSIYFNPENRLEILEEVGKISKTKDIEFPKEKASELTKMISDIAATRRKTLDKENLNMPIKERNSAIIKTINSELKKNGILAKVFLVGGKLDVKFDPRNKNRIMSIAKDYNRNISLGKQQNNVAEINKPKSKGTKINDKHIENPLTR